MSLNLGQLSTRLRSMRWRIPGESKPVNLWGENNSLISKTLLDKLINQGLMEFATENLIDRTTWTLDDGSGGEGTLSIDQRKYALPNDSLVITEARVAYNDTNNFLGYPLIFVNEPFLDSSLTNIETFRLAGPGVDEFNYQSFVTASVLPQTITYASLGADAHGNTPQSTYVKLPFFEKPHAINADVDLIVTAVTDTGFTIDYGAFRSDDPPFTINFTFKIISANLLQQILPTKGLPQRMFIWQDEFWLDPVPDSSYTFRMFGFQLPSTLTSSTSIPDPLEIYHEAIFLKCKELVARELGVLNEGQILGQYNRVAAQAKKLDEMRHDSPKFVDLTQNPWWN